MKAKPKAYVDVTDAQIDAAIERGKRWELYRPVATAVEYDRDGDTLSAFKTGAKLVAPCRHNSPAA